MVNDDRTAAPARASSERHQRARGMVVSNRVIAWSPGSLRAYVVFPDTSPAADNASGRLMDSGPSGHADPQSRNRAPGVSHGSWLVEAFPDCRAGAWRPRPVCRWLARRRLRRAGLRPVLCSAKAGFGWL